MSKDIAVMGATLAGGAAFVIHPHAAIGAAFGCCFFLAVPWGAGRVSWWRRLLLSVFSYGIGYASGAYLFGLGDPNGAMMASGGVSALAAAAFSGVHRAAESGSPLPAWLGDILDRVPFLKRGDRNDG